MQFAQRALLSILLAVVALAGTSCRREPKYPRNVIWILVDTLRADHLSLYGYKRSTSPTLDALARESVTFTQARSQASCTYPSVNSMLTSHWPHQFMGQPGNALGIPAGVPTLAEVLRRQGYRTMAISSSPVVRDTPSRFNPTGGFGRGFDVFHEACVWKAARCVNRALEPQLRRGKKPFFLYVHYLDPHGPYEPPNGYRRRFEQGPKPDKLFIRKGDPNPIAAWLYAGKPNPHATPEDLQYLVDLYDDEIAYFDGRLAEILDSLRKSGLLDESILIFSADHGEEFLEHNHVKHCRTLFDTSIHTPLLVRVPGLPPRTLDAPVSNVDLAPTLLDLLDLDAKPLQAVGRSLRPLLEEGKDDPKAPPRLQFAIAGPLRSVSDGRYKLIQDLGDKGSSVLYDLQADPGETTDVLRQQRQAFFRLRKALGAWLQQTEGNMAAGLSLKQANEAEQKLRSLGYLE